jgi:hypothetical protein
MTTSEAEAGYRKTGMTRLVWTFAYFVASAVLVANATQRGDAPGNESLSEHMHEHLSTIRAVKQFLIAGQLAGMREPAAWLAEHEVAADLPAALPRVEYLLVRIGELGGQADLSEERSQVFGEFLSLCADCHSWTSGGPGVR